MRAAASRIARTVSFERSCAGFFRGDRFRAAVMFEGESTQCAVVLIICRMKRMVDSIWVWARGWMAALFLLRNPDDLDEVFKLDRALADEDFDVPLATERTRADID